MSYTKRITELFKRQDNSKDAENEEETKKLHWFLRGTGKVLYAIPAGVGALATYLIVGSFKSAPWSKAASEGISPYAYTMQVNVPETFSYPGMGPCTVTNLGGGYWELVGPTGNIQKIHETVNGIISTGPNSVCPNYGFFDTGNLYYNSPLMGVWVNFPAASGIHHSVDILQLLLGVAAGIGALVSYLVIKKERDKKITAKHLNGEGEELIAYRLKSVERKLEKLKR